MVIHSLNPIDLTRSKNMRGFVRAMVAVLIASCWLLIPESGLAQNTNQFTGDLSGLFGDPVISPNRPNALSLPQSSSQQGSPTRPKFSRQVSTFKRAQEEAIVGEEILEPMKAELINGGDIGSDYGPIIPGGTSIDQPSSQFPSLGSEATLRGQSDFGQEGLGSTQIQGSFMPGRGLEELPVGETSSTQSTRETSERLKAADPVYPNSTQAIVRDSEMTDDSHDVIRQNYPNGKTKIQRTVAQDATGNYYNDGRWVLFNEQSQPITIGTYSRGKMEGVWLRRHEPGSGGIFVEPPFSMFQGPYKSQASFRRGKLDGQWSLSDREGRTMCEIPYVDGVRHGVAKWFYPSGKPMRQVRFVEGSPDGLLQQWDEQNKLRLQEEYADGRKIVRQRAFYPNKIKSTEEVFQDRKLVVDGEDDWWAARPAPFTTVGERVQHGPTSSWYPNKQPKMRGNYEQNVRQGTFTWWHANGNKELEGRFEEGKKVGTWTWWYASGLKKIQGGYENDEADGPWLWWNEDGQVVDRKTYPLPIEEPDVVEQDDEQQSDSNEPESSTGSNAFNDETFLTTDPFDESDPGSIWDKNGEPNSGESESSTDNGETTKDPTDDDESLEPIFGEPEDETTGTLPARIFENGN